MKDLFRGKLVRLTAEEPENQAKTEVRWQRDSEYRRLSDSDPTTVTSEKKIKEWFEKQNEEGFKPERYPFSIHTLTDGKLIGFTGLWVDLVHAEGWVGIGIGEREFWGKGYGTDAMELVLQYAFSELNMQRVSLALHSYNTRALRSYEKAGFRLEGATRGDQHREGKRTMLFLSRTGLITLPIPLKIGGLSTFFPFKKSRTLSFGVMLSSLVTRSKYLIDLR